MAFLPARSMASRSEDLSRLQARSIRRATDWGRGVDAAVPSRTGAAISCRPGSCAFARAFGESVRAVAHSYDEGACAAGGGILGNAQADLGGRNTYITSCVAALRTYHVWLEEQNVLISASSIGDTRFGEKLMSTLVVPE